MDRPSWTDYLLGLAFVVSRRSPDRQTRHGCVIAGEDHRVLSTGYNGYPRGLAHDEDIPCVRPAKYPWMLHSEVNALASAAGPLDRATAYVTGRACFNCLLLLWQHGVRHVVQAEGKGWERDGEEEALREEFFRQTDGRMRVETVRPDLSWLAGLGGVHGQ